MNHLEQQLHYPLGDTLPAAGTAMEIAPDIKWVRMALPFALDHINLWLLRDEIPDPAQPGNTLQGWSVVDCCIGHPASQAQWEAIFASALDGLPVLRVIVTHMHPDHIGMAQWLCERWSTPGRVCRLWISATDYHSARIGAQSTTGFGGDNAARFFASHGLTDPEAVEKIRARSGYYASMVPGVPPSYCRLMDGQVLRIGGRNWHCISGFGHAPEHIALYCAQVSSAGATGGQPVLISGDMVLPRISTNVSVHEMEPEADALALFLASLEKFLPLHADTLTLPSHGKPFRGLHTRVAQLQQHHQDRLSEVMQACSTAACSATDILPVMFRRKLDLHQTTFAMGEAIAHLHLLWLQGRLQRVVGADGIYRFSAT